MGVADEVDEELECFRAFFGVVALDLVGLKCMRISMDCSKRQVLLPLQ